MFPIKRATVSEDSLCANPLLPISNLGGRCAHHPHLTDEDFKQESGVNLYFKWPTSGLYLNS